MNTLIGKIVKLTNPFVRYAIILEVTEKDINNGINADDVGLYLFRGQWYGEDRLDINSYGKIEGKYTNQEIISNYTDLSIKL